MENAIELFLSMKPRNTARSYRASLTKFFEFLKKKKKRPEKADVDDALGFLTAMNKTYAPATISNRQGALTAYYAFLEATKRVRSNPFGLVNSVLPYRQKHQVRPTATLKPSTIKTLLDLPPRNTRVGIRDRALLSAFFGGGLRRSEAISLNVGDVVINRRGVIVLRLERTKNGADQEQPIRGRFAERICELVAQRKTEGADNPDPLFVAYRKYRTLKHRMSQSTVYRTFKRYAEQAGQIAAPHSARAAAMTKLLLQGFRLIDVKKFARHASYRTIEAYDHRKLEPEKAPCPKFF